MFWSGRERQLAYELARTDYELAKLRCQVRSHREALFGAYHSATDADTAVMDRGGNLWDVLIERLERENGAASRGAKTDRPSHGERSGGEAMAREAGRNQRENQRARTRRSNGSSGSKLMEIKEVLIAAISAVASGLTAWITAVKKYRAEAIRGQLEERRLYIDSLKELVATMNKEIAEYKAEIVQLRQELEQARARIFELEAEVARLKQQLTQ